MRQYKIYQHPKGSLEAIKQGWSWPGFFFSWIWAFVKRLWLIGVILLVLIVIVEFVSFIFGAANETDPTQHWVILIGWGIISIAVGSNGNTWREKNLIARGYDFINTVTASNPEGAIAIHMRENQPT